MEFSEEWKSLWPISSVFSPPLLLHTANKRRRTYPKATSSSPSTEEEHPIGPLIFNPTPNTTIQLHLSSFAPHLPPPFPSLTLPKFLRVSHILPSSSVAPYLADELSLQSSPPLSSNLLQLLPLGDHHSALAIFPAGDNFHSIGYSLLCLDKHSSINIRQLYASVIESNNNSHRILKLVVKERLSCVEKNDNYCYLVAAMCMYAVNWYIVSVVVKEELEGLGTVELEHVGSSKLFSTEVRDVCWSPHLVEQCLVLLGSGEIYLFDLSSRLEKVFNNSSSGVCARKLTGMRLPVLWDSEGLGEWVSCEFSWHPRIFIVLNRKAVFLVDWRLHGGCIVNCLLRLEMLSDRTDNAFVMLSKAGSDGFYYVVASKKLLLLCDVRKPFVPLLRWVHKLENPSYVHVFRLSELRTNAESNEHRWASESGYCILLGSFWDAEFCLFCYGPDNKIDHYGGSASHKISMFCNFLYAWGHPSELNLSGRGCRCGSCLVREEFLKDDFPGWVDWRQKKDLVLGFGVLGSEIMARSSKHDNYGGFWLVRLMSSGKLEVQRYHAAWESEMASERFHQEKILCLKNSLLYDIGGSEYGLKKKFYHLKLEYLKGYLRGDLNKVIAWKMKKCHEDDHDIVSTSRSKFDFHMQICKTLKPYGLGRVKSMFSISDVFEEISLPASIHEVALSSTWAGLPTCLVWMMLRSYLKFPEVPVRENRRSIDFSDILKQLHLKPFPCQKPLYCNQTCSDNDGPSNAPAGPILPPQVMATFHQLQTKVVDVCSPDAELRLKCDEVMKLANEHTTLPSDVEPHNDHVVSLEADTDEMSNDAENPRCFSFHEPLAYLDKSSSVGRNTMKSGRDSKRFTTFIFRKNREVTSDTGREMEGLEMFNAGCPLDLKFNDDAEISTFGLGPIKFGPKELRAYELLKRRHLKFQKGFEI